MTDPEVLSAALFDEAVQRVHDLNDVVALLLEAILDTRNLLAESASKMIDAVDVLDLALGKIAELEDEE